MKKLGFLTKRCIISNMVNWTYSLFLLRSRYIVEKRLPWKSGEGAISEGDETCVLEYDLKFPMEQ
jgi:hypothetical protein